MFKKIIKYQIIICLIYNFIPGSSGNAADMLLNKDNANLKVFYTEDDGAGWNAVLKGKVVSIGVKSESESNEISGMVYDKTQVSVRLYNRDGLKVDDTLFVINRRNLIVSRIKVKSIFKTMSFGYMLIGSGNFFLANPGDRVVQESDSEYSKHAYIYKARGDYYRRLGQIGKAINNYKRAIELDIGNPEAHLELGYIYLKDDMHQFAFTEFNEARKRIARLYDNEDKYLLLKGMAEVRFDEVYFKEIPDNLRTKYIGEGIQYSKEALEVYPDSKDVNFYLGTFYYKNPEPDDVKAKKQFLRVIEIDPDFVSPYVSLSELYFKHKNKDKARLYADKALKLDPANERARFIHNLTD